MKILKTFSGSEYPISEKELEKLKMNYKQNNLFALETGEIINTSAIESITDGEMRAFCNGYMLDEKMKYFIRDGEKIQIEDYKTLEYKPHPKYEAMRNHLKKRMIMLSDNSRTLAQEESAREIRKAQ